MAISGQKLRLTHNGRTVDAVVVFGSENRKSLMVSFEAIVDGCVGMMPVLVEDGVARNVFTGSMVEIEWV